MMKKTNFSQEQIEDILNRYENNESQSKIGEHYGVSRTVIKRVLTENQEKVHLRKRTLKYKGKYDIFENIDTVEKAYWLGFLAADGCNYEREENASIILNIHQKDESHLLKFQQFCDTDANIVSYLAYEGYSNATPMVKIVLNSKKCHRI